MKLLPMSSSCFSRHSFLRAMAVLLVAATGCARWKKTPSASEEVELRLSRSRPRTEDARKKKEPVQEIQPKGEEKDSSPMEIYRIRKGDGLVMMVRTATAEQLEIVVDENGEVRLPLLDPIRAAGLTTTELEQAIKKAYIQGKIYKDVTVHAYVPSRSYFLQGEIRAPGRYPLSQGRITLLQAIATAGGYTDFAASGRVEIIRRGETIRVDVKDLEKYPDRDIQLESGDLIKIPRTRF
jgi:polysaccharide export outer membrane protein